MISFSCGYLSTDVPIHDQNKIETAKKSLKHLKIVQQGQRLFNDLIIVCSFHQKRSGLKIQLN